MGMGIWAMHYIGMLAYSLPVLVLYDWPTVLWSLLAAILASAVALFVVSRSQMGLLSISFGGLFMGTGIAAMHYVGMEAMRLPAMCHYSAGLVLLSVILAVVISLVALWLTFHLRGETQSLTWRKRASALLMGSAIPVMHYTGMAAVTFTPMVSKLDLTHAVEISSIGLVGIGSVSLTLLGIAILTSAVDRRFSAQSLELQLSEQRYRQLVESAQVILWRADADTTEFSYVNQQAAELLGYPAEKWINTPAFWRDHLHPEDRESVVSFCTAVAENHGPQRFEHRMTTAEDTSVWLRTSVCQVASGEKRELIGVMTDITERKRAQEAAEGANQANTALLAEIKKLNDQLRKENSRMSAELEVTQRLQQMMLPRDEDFRQIADLDISGFMEPAAEVGGDYYDVVAKGGSVVFGIGDVTGHGLESGVIAIMVQTAVRTLLASGQYESRRFFEVLNHDGALERHDTLNLGFALGLEQDISSLIGEAQVPLQSGDVMVVYTDGITEAVNCAGVTFGVERLSEAVRASHGKPADGIRQAVLSSLREYVGGQRLLDDISLLIVKPA